MPGRPKQNLTTRQPTPPPSSQSQQVVLNRPSHHPHQTALRSLPPGALTMLRVPLRRGLAGAARPPVHSQLAPSLQSPIVRLQTRMQSQALSNPTLANIEKRWEAMPPQEQAELWMALRGRI